MKNILFLSAGPIILFSVSMRNMFHQGQRLFPSYQLYLLTIYVNVLSTKIATSLSHSKIYCLSTPCSLSLDRKISLPVPLHAVFEPGTILEKMSKILVTRSQKIYSFLSVLGHQTKKLVGKIFFYCQLKISVRKVSV